MLASLLIAWLVQAAGALTPGAVPLVWDANTETDLAGYEVLYGTIAGSYPQTVNVGKVTHWTFDKGEPGKTYYFVVQAYNTRGERSERSSEIRATIPVGDEPPPPPKDELCNGVDDNGDGRVDEDCPPPPPFDHATGVYHLEVGSDAKTLTGTVALKAYVAALPGDGFRGSTLSWSTFRHVFDSTDALKAFVAGIVIDQPPPELCGDKIDNDGDGQIDEGCPPPSCTDVPTVFITRWEHTTGRPGSRMRVNFQLNSQSQIQMIQVKVAGTVVATITGTDLKDTAGAWFTAPASGSYKLQVLAKNAAGCTKEVYAPVDLVVK